MKTFRDSSAVFYRYRTDRTPIGIQERSADGCFRNEKYMESEAWAYAIQKTNTAMLLTIPNLTKHIPLRTDILKLDIVFPAHYGTIRRSVIGNGAVREGGEGESAEVVPVSIETGEVFLHIVPLIPTALPRTCAIRFRNETRYQVLELINYDGENRRFDTDELEFIQNGFVFTIDSRRKWKSLEEFHRMNSDFLLVDYTIHRHRFVRFKRNDVQFEVCYTPANFGVQTHAVDGRTTPEPVLETNQLDVSSLPFLSGSVPADVPLFPWGDSLAMHNYPENAWIIGSRGLPGEAPYSRIRQAFPDRKKAADSLFRTAEPEPCEMPGAERMQKKGAPDRSPFSVFFRSEECAYRSTRAPAPPTSFSTSLSVAMLVSPGVVMASAPCAAP